MLASQPRSPIFAHSQLQWSRICEQRQKQAFHHLRTKFAKANPFLSQNSEAKTNEIAETCTRFSQFSIKQPVQFANFWCVSAIHFACHCVRQSVAVWFRNEGNFCLTLPHMACTIRMNLWGANSSLWPKLHTPSYQNAPDHSQNIQVDFLCIQTSFFHVWNEHDARVLWSFFIESVQPQQQLFSRKCHRISCKHVQGVSHHTCGHFSVDVRTIKKHFVANLCFPAKYRRLLNAASLFKLRWESMQTSGSWP